MGTTEKDKQHVTNLHQHEEVLWHVRSDVVDEEQDCHDRCPQAQHDRHVDPQFAVLTQKGAYVGSALTDR